MWILGFNLYVCLLVDACVHGHVHVCVYVCDYRPFEKIGAYERKKKDIVRKAGFVYKRK